MRSRVFLATSSFVLFASACASEDPVAFERPAPEEFVLSLPDRPAGAANASGVSRGDGPDSADATRLDSEADLFSEERESSISRPGSAINETIGLSPDQRRAAEEAAAEHAALREEFERAAAEREAAESNAAEEQAAAREAEIEDFISDWEVDRNRTPSVEWQPDSACQAVADANSATVAYADFSGQFLCALVEAVSRIVMPDTLIQDRPVVDVLVGSTFAECAPGAVNCEQVFTSSNTSFSVTNGDYGFGEGAVEFMATVCGSAQADASELEASDDDAGGLSFTILSCGFAVAGEQTMFRLEETSRAGDPLRYVNLFVEHVFDLAA